MTYNDLTGRNARPNDGRTLPRIQELAEAGAKGWSLSPIEVRAVCEALRTQTQKTPTRFHSGFGA